MAASQARVGLPLLRDLRRALALSSSRCLLARGRARRRAARLAAERHAHAARGRRHRHFARRSAARDKRCRSACALARSSAPSGDVTLVADDAHQRRRARRSGSSQSFALLGQSPVTRVAFATAPGRQSTACTCCSTPTAPATAHRLRPECCSTKAWFDPPRPFLDRDGWSGGSELSVPWTRALSTSGSLDYDLTESGLAGGLGRSRLPPSVRLFRGVELRGPPGRARQASTPGSASISPPDSEARPRALANTGQRLAFLPESRRFGAILVTSIASCRRAKRRPRPGPCPRRCTARRIVVADDDRITRELLAGMLREHGFIVETVRGRPGRGRARRQRRRRSGLARHPDAAAVGARGVPPAQGHDQRQLSAGRARHREDRQREPRRRAEDRRRRLRVQAVRRGRAASRASRRCCASSACTITWSRRARASSSSACTTS